jgi:hypothetical protein
LWRDAVAFEDEVLTTADAAADKEAGASPLRSGKYEV